MSIKDKIWKRATNELNYHNTKENFEYEEPIIDLTIEEVKKEVEEIYREGKWQHKEGSDPKAIVFDFMQLIKKHLSGGKRK